MRLSVWLVALFLLLSLPAEAKRRRGSRSSGRRGDPALTNVGVSLGLFGGALLLDDFHVVSEEEALWYAGGWIGGTYHPRTEKVSPFMAVGTELGVVVPPSRVPGGDRTRTGVEVVPSARLGVSVLSDDLGHLFPDFEVYVLGGYRIPNSVRGHALRLGAGISIPASARARPGCSTSSMTSRPGMRSASGLAITSDQRPGSSHYGCFAGVEVDGRRPLGKTGT